jgi:hypothetical protein
LEEAKRLGLTFSGYWSEKQMSMNQWTWIKRVLVRKGVIADPRRPKKKTSAAFVPAHCPGGGGDASDSDDSVSDPASLGMDDRVRELSGSLLDVSGHGGRGAMMRPAQDVKVYLHREPIDMRRGRNGLAALVREAMTQDPFAPEALYVFVGRRYDTLKIFELGSQRVCDLVEEDRER